MESSSNYLAQIKAILGCDPSSDDLSLNLSWDNHTEGKAALDKIRAMQRELKLLKKNVSADASNVRSEYASDKAQVGSGVGNVISGAIFGRRLIGKINVLERDRLRRAALSAQEPFNVVKNFIDECVLKLDAAKAQIQSSESYQRTKKATAIQATEDTPNSTQNFYVYLDNSVKGPFTKEQLLALCQVGTVDPFTQICIAGTETWLPFHSCKEAQ